MKKIAVIGSGISGLTCAYYLSEKHEVMVFEQDSRIGGHTATKAVTLDGQDYAIDTGFIVFNEWTYPNFIRLLAELKVPWRDSEMSFSVSCQRTGIEYAGSNLSTLFAQKRNLLSPYFIGMIRDILRFNKQAPVDLAQGRIPEDMCLGDYLHTNAYSKGFIDHYLIPMGAAIWSTSLEDMLAFPLQFFVRFFSNHGLLSVKNRPQWKTIVGGSSAYLAPITKSFSDRIVLNAQIKSVSRKENGVSIVVDGQPEAVFDHVIFACHSDQALALLGDANATEREILSAIPYENNDVVLHTDSHLLPKHPKARASWNYSLPEQAGDRATLTYDMNTLQGIQSSHDFLVTLNQLEDINPDKILGHYHYSHPQFTLAGMKAQARWSEINSGNTWFCGAYWRNGFHEDGVHSALRVVNAIQGESQRSCVLDGHARRSDIEQCESLQDAQ